MKLKKALVILIFAASLFALKSVIVFADPDDPDNPPTGNDTVTATSTETPTPISETSDTPTPAADTDTPTPTNDPSDSPTDTSTPTSTPTNKADGWGSITKTPTRAQRTVTPTNTPVPTPSNTPAPTNTPRPTSTPRGTNTPTPTYGAGISTMEHITYPAPKKASDKTVEIKSNPVIKIDGIYEDLWDTIESVPIQNVSWGEKGASGSFKTCWDKTNLYLLVEVKDDTPDTAAEKFSRKDCVEIFFDETGTRPENYGLGNYHYKISRTGEIELGYGGDETYIKYAVIEEENGYKVEVSLKFVEVTPKYGDYVGLDVRVNDSQNDQYRDYMIQWSDTSMYTFENLSKTGLVYLK